MERGAAGKDPVILPASIGFMTRAAVITALREVLHEVAEMFAVRKFSGAWHRKDIGIVLVRNQAQGRVGGKTRIGHHDCLAYTGWGDKVFQHLPKEDVLMPFDRRVHQGESDWNTSTAPAGDQQDHLKPKGIRIMLAMARRVPQGMFPTAVGFQGTIPNEIEDPIVRRRECPERARRQGT